MKDQVKCLLPVLGSIALLTALACGGSSGSPDPGADENGGVGGIAGAGAAAGAAGNGLDVRRATIDGELSRAGAQANVEGPSGVQHGKTHHTGGISGAGGGR